MHARLTFERYELTWVSQGGMSQIYRGRHREDGREVLVKVVAVTDRAPAAALIREREALVRLDHPSVVRALDWVDEQGFFGLVLEHVEGVDLEALLRQRDIACTEARVRDWARQIAEVLDYLHTQRPALIYRDLKPSNLILRPDGRIVLIDFGAARVKTPERSDTIALGTPGYAAPEQYGQAASDERSDVYALGVTLFELLSGRDPAACNFDFPPLRTLGVPVTEALEAVIARSVHSDPSQRFPSARAFLDALKADERSPQPRRLMSGLALAMGMLAVGWGAGTPAPAGLAYGVALAAFALGALAAVRTQPPSRVAARGTATLLMVLTLAAWALIPTCLGLADVQAVLRRLALEAGAPEVPLTGSVVMWALLGAVCVLWGHLIGCAAGRRQPSLAVLGALAFGGVAGGHLLQQAVARDAAQGATQAWKAQWAVVPEVERLVDMTRLEEPHWRGLVVRSEDGSYAVHSLQDGACKWRGKADSRRLVEPFPGYALAAVGSVLEVRIPQSGALHARVSLPARVRRMDKSEHRVYLTLTDGSLQCVDPRAGRILWAWRGAGEDFELGASDEVVFVLERSRARLAALDGESGAQRWVHPLVDVPRSRLARLGGRWLWCRADGVDLVDPQVGTLQSLVRLDRIGSGASQPLKVRMLDGKRLVVVAGSWLIGLQLDPASTLWKVRLPHEPLSLHEASGGVLYLATAGGRLLGLDAQRGTVVWESWARSSRGLRQPQVAQMEGDEAAWSLLESLPTGIFMQEHGRDEVSCVDAQSGRLRWRLPGLEHARAWLDDESRVLVLQEPPLGKARILSVEYPRDEAALHAQRTSPR